VSFAGYARDVLPLGAGWAVAFALFRGRFVPTWLVGATLGVAIRSIALGHFHPNVLAFWLVTLVFLGLVAGLMRLVARRLAL
jgi:hypothetical protein